jgi:tetratricopeptide (TPR) repeat protein
MVESSGMWNRRVFRWAFCLVIFAVVAAVFQGARHGEFLLWDDNINIVSNPHLREFTWEKVRWMFTDASYMRRYVPVAWLGWSLDHQFFGLTPVSAHVGNILFHALNAVLVFLLLKRVLASRGVSRAGRSEPGSLVVAGAGALIWALHPMRAEVVGWASGRMYCQAGFFLLLAGLAYFRAAECGTQRMAHAVWILVATAAYGLSLLTYPIGVMFVAVLVVIDVFVLRRFPPGASWLDRRVRGIWLEKIPFVAVAGAVAAATLAARFQAQGLWQPPPSLEEFGLFARIMQACYVEAYYVWKPLFPSNLAPVYTTLLGFNPSAPIFVFSALAVGITTALLIWQRRRWPAALALWACHLILLAPMTGLTERPHYANDRYSYLAGIVWSLAFAVGAFRIERLGFRRAGAVITGAVILVFTVLSLGQMRIWRNSITLFESLYHRTDHVVTRADLAFRLGDALRVQSRIVEAANYYRESLRLAPVGSRAAVPHFGLGKIAHAAGRLQEAVNHYEAAIRLDPAFTEAYLGLGHVLVSAGRSADAIPFLQRAASLQPANADGRELLGVALFQTGKYAASAEEFAAANRLRPASAPLLCNLAAALIASGRIPEALSWSQQAVKLDPVSVDAWLNLGDSLRLSGRGPEAIETFRQAVRLQPTLPRAHNQLGTALATSGHLAEAVGSFREAIRLDPAFAQAHFNLGLALRDTGDRDEAARAFSTVLRLQPDHSAAREELARLQPR